jgi:hypothetical protein
MHDHSVRAGKDSFCLRPCSHCGRYCFTVFIRQDTQSDIFLGLLFPGLTKNSKSKAIPVTYRGGLYGCEILRIPLCLDNRLTDGGEVVSLTRGQLSTPHKFLFLYLVLVSVRG